MPQLDNKKINKLEETHLKNNLINTDKSLSEHYFDQKLKEELVNIPERIYFKIGEVANLLNIKTSVLRYWETEFNSFSPSKSGKNQKVYKKKDVEQLFLIKKLLYRDRFSVEGAKSILTQAKKSLKVFIRCKK